MQHFSRYSDKGPSIAEGFNRTGRDLLKKPVFEKRNADWLSELPSGIKQKNNTTHRSIKMTPFQASKKVNEKILYNILKDNREIQKPNFKLGQLVRKADIKRIFSKGDSTNYSYKLFTITEVIHITIPSYRHNYLPERFNENLLLPTKLSLEQNNQFTKETNLFQ